MKGIRNFQETREHFSSVAQTQTIGSSLLSLSNKEKAENGLSFACSSQIYIQFTLEVGFTVRFSTLKSGMEQITKIKNV